jgi:hypothetical protein
MPNALINALTALAWAAALFLLFLILWLFYCDCQRWAARTGSLEWPHVAQLK